MNYYPFDSRNSLYRNKFGAIAEGETLRLRLLLHKNAKVYEAFLLIREDSETEYKELRLIPDGWLEEYRFYVGEITLNTGLYWYSFRYISEHGEFFVKREGESLGIVTNNGQEWQLTVYSPNFTTPDWLDGGIIYQIFPDRFYNSGTPKKNVPTDRYICDDWYKQPEYRQREDILRLGNDYYGGDLKGIEQKLPYIKSLGVNCIYLNPIFEAHSNHRYNTANYYRIDPLLGTEADLVSLINAAKSMGIYIILDGVFSHTGDDSLYFNKFKRYNTVGAFNSTASPFYSWYKFEEYPQKYKAWWGVPSLPETDEDDLSYSNFISGENGVIRYWLRKGIRGFRLDVADELPDNIIRKIRSAVKSEGEGNYLLGEVWEDASNKISYGKRRSFLLGRQLDSVMNYPFADAIIAFLKEQSAERLMTTVMRILENYPKPAIKLLMNHIGTHDTARIITRLGTDNYPPDRETQSKTRLTKEEYNKGVRLLKLAAVLQFTLPGVPSIYYGDEAGLTGYGDPFCRAAYPWGKEDTNLLEFYRSLGKFRNENTAFASGEFLPLCAKGGLIVYMRSKPENKVLVAVNSGESPCEIELPYDFGGGSVTLNPCDYLLINNNLHGGGK
ncbi:MAG: glycoside hydrolase family 13 protein [Acutalibacteraceae bacterium]|jgi:cyclomaltodextrinase